MLAVPFIVLTQNPDLFIMIIRRIFCTGLHIWQETANKKQEEDNMVCSKCKKKLMDDMAFCPYCGNKVEKVAYPKCGAPLVADAKFCSSCGAPAEQTTPADDEISQLIENAPISEEAFPKSSVLQESHTAKDDNKPITLCTADIEGGALNANLVNVIIDDSVTEIKERAFSGCKELTSITIPDSVTKIGDSAFYECTNLTSITIPDSVTEIGDYAFYQCTNLTSITIPDSVTKIGGCAFYDCPNLTSITIPDSVTEIGDNAFANTRVLANEKSFDYSKTVLEKHDYKKLDTESEYSYFLVKEQYKSKGETKYRYTYTSGGIERKFTMNASDYNKCWHYDNCLFVNVDEALYMHKGASSQLRYLCDIGTNIDLFCNNSDVIAVGSKGYLMCSTSSKALTSLEMPEDETRFLYGVYNDGSISIGSSVPDNVCVINKDKKIESKKIPALMKHICNNIFNYHNKTNNRFRRNMEL